MAAAKLFSFLRNRVLSNIIGFAVGSAATIVFEPAIRPLSQELEVILARPRGRQVSTGRPGSSATGCSMPRGSPA